MLPRSLYQDVSDARTHCLETDVPICSVVQLFNTPIAVKWCASHLWMTCEASTSESSARYWCSYCSDNSLWAVIGTRRLVVVTIHTGVASAPTGPPRRWTVGSLHLSLGVLMHRAHVGRDIWWRRRGDGNGDGVGVLASGHCGGAHECGFKSKLRLLWKGLVNVDGLK